jgi:hypothetical protein
MNLAEQVQSYEIIGNVWDLLTRLEEESFVAYVMERPESAIYVFTDGSAWGTDSGVTADRIIETFEGLYKVRQPNTALKVGYFRRPI